MTNSLTETLSDLVASAHRISRIAASETGETTSSVGYSVLSMLIESGPQRVGQLATTCRLSQPGMTKVVAGLEASGWVRRDADPLDARASVVTITEPGREARRQRLRRIGAAIEPYFAGISDDDRRVLERAAAILADRAKAAPRTIERTQQ